MTQFIIMTSTAIDQALMNAGFSDSTMLPREVDGLVKVTRRCCRTLAVKDSHHESMRLEGRHEQAQTRPLPHDELVRLQRCASEARVVADLAGQGDELARAA